MMENRAFKFRLYPLKDQEQNLRQHGGNARFVYNKLLERSCAFRDETGEFIFGRDLEKELLILKTENPFLNLSYSQSLQKVAQNLAQGFINRFVHHSADFPTLKKKRGTDSFTYKQNWSMGPRSIHLPKIGRIRMVRHRPLVGKPTSVTIVQDGDLWFASILCRVEVKEIPPRFPEEDSFVGVDLGIKDFAVVSDGTVIENPKHLRKSTKKIRRASRWLSRKVKGSKNREKSRDRLTNIHRKIRNHRKDFHHKVSRSMIAKCSGISLETLNIQGMLKNHKLARAIADCGWGQFVQFLEYKGKESGKLVIKIGRWFPSTKTCSDCGELMDISLKQRIYVCKGCGLIIDRDFNASLNIRSEGLEILRIAFETLPRGTGEGEGLRPSNACGEESSGQESQGTLTKLFSVKQENFQDGDSLPALGSPRL
jgi:putative transposase